MKEIKRISEEELRNLIREKVRKNLITEMPYDRNVYVSVVDTNTRDTYTHFCKLFLYQNTTLDANGWINEISNKYTVPILNSKVHVSNRAKAKIIVNGFINNIFGSEFEDYYEQMKMFCVRAISEMETYAQKKNLNIPQHIDVNDAIYAGKDVIIRFCEIIKDFAYNGIPSNANEIIKSATKEGMRDNFGLEC